MTDEEARARRAPAPPPRQPARPPDPRPRNHLPEPTPVSPINLPAPPRLIRPSEHLALVEWSERRPVHPLVPTVTVIQGPRPTLPPPPPVHRHVAPPQPRMPAPAPQPVMRQPQQSRRDIQFSENTFKNYYYPDNHQDQPSSDEEGTVGLKIRQAIAKKRPANSIDSFLERPKKKTRVLKKSSNVSQSSADGVAYLSSGQDEAGYASHLIKIEVYDMDKIRNVAPADHWKHCDIRLKYYSASEDDVHVQSARDVIFNITKQLASKENSVKYFIETDKKK